MILESHQPAVDPARQPGSAPPRISVVVCSLGESPHLYRCLYALERQARCAEEILLVLNGPQPAERVAGLQKRFPEPWLRVLQEPRRGVSIARNRAIPEAAGEILAFLDDDVTVHPGWLEAIAGGFDQPSVVCVTGKVLAETPGYHAPESYSDRSDNEWCVSGTDPDWFRLALSTYTGLGCNMAFRRSFLEQTPLPEDLGAGSIIGCGDENFMFFQVLKQGYTLRHIPSARVTHLFSEDHVQLKERQREIYAGGVALHLKLLVEEPRHRLATLRELFSRIGRAVRYSIQPQGAPGGWENFTVFEKLSLGWQGIRLLLRSRRHKTAR